MWKALSAAPLIAALLLPTASAQVVERAPAFAVRDTQGKLVTLTDFDERVLILEWTRPDCDAVQTLYDTDNLPELQRKAVAAGAIWLTVFSTARHKEGFLDSDQVAATQHNQAAHVTASLVDDTGIMARTYKVSRAPHIVIIDIAGRIAWQAGAAVDVATLDSAITDVIANRAPPPVEPDQQGCELAL